MMSKTLRGLAEVQSEMLITDENRSKIIRAMSEIKNLKAENEKLRKDKEWISVKDELPKSAESGNWTAVNVFCEDGHIRIYDYNIKSKIWKHGLNDIMVKVTHWQPLPEPPK